MKKILSLFVTLLIVHVIVALDYAPNEIIVKFNHDLQMRNNSFDNDSINQLLRSKGNFQISKAIDKNIKNTFIIHFDEASVENTVAELKQFSDFEYVQPNYLRDFFVIPNDPNFSEQQLDLINIPPAWDRIVGSSNVLIGVIDSGIYMQHPDLQKNIWVNQAEIEFMFDNDNFSIYDVNNDNNISFPEIISYLEENNFDFDNDGDFDQQDVLHPDSPFTNQIDDDNNGYEDDIFGWDFTDAPSMIDEAVGDYLIRDNDPTDENSHGTHVAGIIGATANNGLGISGICWNVNLLTIRAGHRTTFGGYLQDDDIASAIIYATDMGVDIINASWGSDSDSPIISDAINYAFSHDVIVVCASGNSGKSGVSFPAKLINTIAVGAVDQFKTRSAFSSYGNEIDVMAPGNLVLSTVLSDSDTFGYGNKSGTSMAAPHVSGVIGLLLAQDPTLNFNEIKFSLAESAEDIGVEGFDTQTGYGLIDANNLLSSSIDLLIEINSPQDFSGASDNFEIIGTAKAANFSRYTVMYTDKESPTSSDWYNVYSPHNNSPTSFYDEKDNETLAEFEISPTFPEGEYTIMLKMYLADNSVYNAFTHIIIDRTSPNLENYQFQERFESNSSTNYLYLEFDDKVNSTISINYGFETTIISSDVYDNVHYFEIDNSNSINSISINAVNIANLQMAEIILDDVELNTTIIPVGSYSSTESGEAISTVQKFIPESNDFLGSRNRIEVFSPIQKFHLSENQISVVATIQDTSGNFIEETPIDIGNTNSEKLEFLSIYSNIVSLYESTHNDSTKIFNKILEIPECYGANFADFNGNQIDDILCCTDMNLSDEGTERVIKLFARTGSNFSLQYTLFNESETNLKNTFHNVMKTGLLDTDDKYDVLVTDQDGDAMIYELDINGASNLIWSERLPVQSANLLEIGDFNGNGQTEFCVGGYFTNEFSDNDYWNLSVYETTGNDSFALIQQLFFSDVQNISRNNSINVADIDNDGSDELICSFTPNTYILDYVDGKLAPIWTGQSGFSYRTLIKEATDSSSAKIILNTTSDEDSQVQIVQISDENLLEPPHNFDAIPISESQINLTWSLADADYYNIYRMNPDEEIILLSTSDENNYLDESVLEGKLYQYAISLVNQNNDPPESIFTNWLSATPNRVPKLLSAKMSSSNQVEIIFDSPLSDEALKVGNYQLDHDYGLPSSAILIMTNKQVCLTFDDIFEENSKWEFILSVSNLTGETGVPIPNQTISFDFQTDVEPPEIQEVNVISDYEIEAIFTESIEVNSATNMSNFTVEIPAEIGTNSITNLSLITPNILKITFEKKLMNSNQSYFLFMKNISDIYGNVNPKIETCFSLTEIADMKFIEIFPNPLRVSEMEGVKFLNLPLDSVGKIWIYNLSGDLVFDDNFGPLSNQSEKYFEWKAVNNRYKKVSSGTYFYVLKMQDEIKKGTIVLIR